MRHYPEYKESGVNWIGEIPRHWEMKKIKNTQSDLVGGVWGNEPAENENDIYCIRVADFNYEQLTISTHNLTLRNIPLKEEDKRILQNYDLLVEKSGGGEKSPVGKIVMFNAELSRQSVTSNFITKFTAKSDSCFPKYLLYCLCFFYHIGLTRRHIKQTTGIQNLDIDSYFKEKIPLPSLVEQTQIVNFLDRKTEQIDELIRNKERRIELLQEQRTALINQVVTKGLDPNVEMKPSGVEWIGEIPVHWEVVRCTHLFELKHIKNTSGEINLSVYRDYGVIRRDSRNDNYNRISEDTSSYKLVEPGDFVFNKMKCWQGSLGISEYRGIVSPAYTVCKPKRHFQGKYFHHLLRSYSYIQEFNRLSYGIRTSQWELRFEDFKDIVVPYPTILEQTQIANFLDSKTKQIDEMITAEQRKIELLQEFRQSLISEAVTGKIDVRNED